MAVSSASRSMNQAPLFLRNRKCPLTRLLFPYELQWPSETGLQSIISLLDRVIYQVGARPKYLISDQEGQFFSEEMNEWCRSRGITQRFGGDDSTVDPLGCDGPTSCP